MKNVVDWAASLLDFPLSQQEEIPVPEVDCSLDDIASVETIVIYEANTPEQLEAIIGPVD